MKMLESLKGGHLSVLALLAAGGLAVGACGGNTSGEGNEFTVKAKIVRVGKHSVTVRIKDILEAQGKAEGWFKEDEPPGKTHQIHDNYQDCGTFSGLNLHTVGKETDIEGFEEELQDVNPGAYVELSGRIRDSYYHCKSGKYDSSKWKARPVFDQLTEFVLPEGWN